MTDDPDAALVRECRAGNRRAFEQLLVRYERPIFNAAYRILNHREDATDVTQTVFLRAYEHFGSFDPNQRFFSWIYRIAVNEAFDMAHGRRRAEPVVDELESDRAGPDEAAATGQLDAVFGHFRSENRRLLRVSGIERHANAAVGLRSPSLLDTAFGR